MNRNAQSLLFETSMFRQRYAGEFRIEMHLESKVQQSVYLQMKHDIPAFDIRSAEETQFIRNSYKSTRKSIHSLLDLEEFSTINIWKDPDNLFCLTLAEAR
jgi:uncharacterized SAM-dependent methyltransferase